MSKVKKTHILFEYSESKDEDARSERRLQIKLTKVSADIQIGLGAFFGLVAVSWVL
jgi:hypothetical protein